MIKQEIIEKISRYFKLTQFEAEKIYDDIFSIVIQGVKEDNIVDLTNFGEFIIKYNNGKEGNTSEYKKTVEFLATSKLEEDINDKFTEHETKSLEPPVILQEPQKPEIIKETFIREEFTKEAAAVKNAGDVMDDDMRKKREEIIHKIEHTEKKTEESVTPVIPLVQPIVSTESVEAKEKIVEKIEEVKKTEEIRTEKSKQEIDELSQKTFSDYFSEVKNEPVKEKEKIKETIQENINKPGKQEEHIIPKSAVELHNQITSKDSIKTYPVVETPAPVLNTGNGNGNGNGHGNGNGSNEYVLDDNSYYIWYKDTESSPNETQTMSYEYELLYQATKEAEYQSKLKIYVSTFIIFFSIVLILLIFSPLIYKVFFKTPEVQKTENVDEGVNTQDNSNQNNVTPQQSQPDKTTQSNQQSNQNTTGQTNTEQKTEQTTQPVQTSTENTKPKETPKQETKPIEQPQQKVEQKTEPKQEQKTETKPEQKTDGVVKNSLGFMDDKLKVIYVQLDNGKYTIQESAWDSDAKANKRISTVESFGITGLKGSVFKVDLEKGTWYRARFGEFTTIQEAKSVAEKMRSREKIKLQAFLLTFLMYT